MKVDLTPSKIQKLKVSEIKDELEERGVDVSELKLKKDLVSKLCELVEADGSDSQANIQEAKISPRSSPVKSIPKSPSISPRKQSPSPSKKESQLPVENASSPVPHQATSPPKSPHNLLSPPKRTSRTPSPAKEKSLSKSDSEKISQGSKDDLLKRKLAEAKAEVARKESSLRPPSLSPVKRRGDVSDDEGPSKRPHTESVNPSVIHISNLVRPFTTSSLTELLERYGQLASNGLWVDSIKSQCIAKFTSQSSASSALKALQNFQWPLAHGKPLQVNFSSEEEFNKHRESTDSNSKLSDGSNTTPAPTATLDDLFCKTKAKPPIYWLPLTEEQVKEKKSVKSN